MKASMQAISVTLMLLLAGSCFVGTTSASKNINGRKLKAYEGCSQGSWGSVCTTDNNDGTSTICTETPYYSRCDTYPNDSLPPTPPATQSETPPATETPSEESDDEEVEAPVPAPAPSPDDDEEEEEESGRRLLADKSDTFSETLDNSNGRGLKAFEGCSRGSWGSVCSTDNEDGTTTICVSTPQYTGCTTYPNDKLPDLLVDGERILLAGSEDQDPEDPIITRES